MIHPEFAAGRRILAVSDIHGNLPFFRGLLQKVRFTPEDILVLDGDMLEKGRDSLALLRYMMELSRTHTVYPICGNCDGLVFRFFETDELDGRFYASYLPQHPESTIRQLADEVLRTDTRGVEALQYGPIEGIRDLREVVVRELLAPKGIDCGVDNVIIITGGLEGINLACQAYIDPGDVILVEAPTFVQSVEIFDMFEARCVGVAMDDNGLIPEDLERKIRQCHPKMIYVIPTFQNPSGRTLSLERRKAVAELAAKYDVLVLEDDPYRDIRYSGEDLPPIKHFDTTGHVVMAGSFSKIFSPGSRLGYVVADTETIQHLVDVKSATNSHTSMLPQILCAEFFKRGCYPAHHQMICDLYRRRRDVMLQSIDRYFPAGTKHSNPDGGLFTWVELPGGIDTSALLQESSTDPAVNVAFVAGEGFFSDRDGQGKNCMRMSFGNTPEDLIEEGVRRLGGLICSKLNK